MCVLCAKRPQKGNVVPQHMRSEHRVSKIQSRNIRGCHVNNLVNFSWENGGYCCENMKERDGSERPSRLRSGEEAVLDGKLRVHTPLYIGPWALLRCNGGNSSVCLEWQQGTLKLDSPTSKASSGRWREFCRSGTGTKIPDGTGRNEPVIAG